MALESLPKIAPALFSAEQDLIQIYNKKSDTVGTINASLIGTPPSGVSGAIQFSNGSAFGSDSANLFWDNVNKRLGVGTNAPVSDVTINSATGNPTITLQKAGVSRGSFYEDNGGTKLQGAGNGLWLGANGRQDMVFTWDGNNYTQSTTFTFGANSSLGARVGIKGSGSTSATTSLLVQNSAGSEAFRVRDDGRTLANSGISVSKDGYAGFQSNGIYNSFGYQMNPEDNLTVLKVGFGVGTSVTTLLKVDNTLNSTASGPTTKPLVILANASQTANLVELQNSSGTALSVFTADGKLGVGIPTPVGKAEVLVGFADPSTLAQAESFRLRSTTVDGNTRVMNFGISHTGAGGANQGYGYIQFGYSGGSADNPLVLQPLAGGVSVGSPLALSDYKLQVLQESSIKAAANTGGGALGGRLSFPPAGPYSGKVAYIAQVQDGISWTTSAGLVFATASSGDISGSTGTERMRISGSGNLGVGEVNPLAKTHIKGSGSTSATTSLLVQNSAGSQGLKIDDNSGFQIGSMAAAGQGQGIRTDSGGGGINAGINTNFNNGATWNDDANVCALKIAYNNGIRIANTTRYPLTLGSDTKAVASAQLEMVSTTQGFLPPRMTDAQIRAIASPAEGLIAYNTTINHLCAYKAGAWVKFNHSSM
jgi:hypothetical protein